MHAGSRTDNRYELTLLPGFSNLRHGKESGSETSHEDAGRRAGKQKSDSFFFVSFDYADDALREIESFFRRRHKIIVALTVQEILDEHIAKKLV